MKCLCNTVDYSLKANQDTKILQVFKWQKMLIAKEISTTFRVNQLFLISFVFFCLFLRLMLLCFVIATKCSLS